MSWAKVHLLSSDEPVTFGGDLQSACQVSVPRAVAIDATCGCKGCWENFRPKKYCYAIIAGEESMREES